MSRTTLPKWLVAALLVPALLSLFSIYRRFQAETLNRATSFAAEYETIANLAASQGVTMDEAARQLKPEGLNAIVISEETVAEMIARGRVRLSSSYDPNEKKSIASLEFADPDALKRAQMGLKIRLQDLAGPLVARDNLLAMPAVDAMLVRTVAVGLNPDQADFARRNGLIIVARCSNPPGVSAKTVEQTLDWAHQLGATVFLPQGDQVLGRRNSIQTTIDTLRAQNMLYASAEFAKIGGDEEIVRTAPDMIVRLHSAQAAELDKLSLADAVERYSKASRERNMRILLVRPFTYGDDKPLTAFADFLHKIQEQVMRSGGALGAPKPFGPPGLPRGFPILIGLTVIPAAWFVGTSFFTSKRARTAAIVLLALLAVASVKPIGLQAMAFVGSVVFPVAAFLVLDALRPKNVALGFVLVSAISLIGGLCVAGMLNGLPFYVMAEQFLGVKVSIFLPILIIGYLFLDRLAQVREIGQSPITWGTATLGLVVIGLLGIMIARTGNDTGVGPSGGETMFRGILDRFLYVRPRTKEFLIGHPLLVVGIGMLSYLTKRRSENPTSADNSLANWTVLVIMVGSMGQTSIVNTLTHLHIPVVLSLARIGLGTIIGCIIGLGLWGIVKRFLPSGSGA